ncbi:hypothetical protein [Streptomyces werraensis]|uniref:hypothetical protein n=1 Tax=Streptomyces werraensis TaxID=68284 RepID=UPI0034227EB6
MGRLNVLERLGSAEEEAEEISPWWFDTEHARAFVEGETDWDGSNDVYRTTGSQWDSESLWVTASCKYALHFTSRQQGVSERVTELDVKQAVDWLIRNGTDVEEHVAKLPSEVLDEYRSRQG